MPFADVKRVVEAQLGAPLASAFASFDERPLATASVAQVHAATTRATGARVVVKVLKPGVADTLAADLALLTSVAKVLEAVAPETKRVALAFEHVYKGTNSFVVVQYQERSDGDGGGRRGSAGMLSVESKLVVDAGGVRFYEGEREKLSVT